MAKSTQPVQLRVASYNLRCPCDAPPNDWPSRAPRVARTLSRYEFDIFGAQEAVDAQIKFITEDVGYQCVGLGRERGFNGEYSCIFYRPGRLDCLGAHTIWLSETPSVPGSKSWDSACCRICTFGRFRERSTGWTFIMANTHLDHVSRPAMSNGARVILDHLEQYFGDYCVMLTGDFNTYPDTEPVEIVSASMLNARLVSETPHAGPDGATYHAYKVDPQERKHNEPIDYIFVSSDIRVLRHEAVDDFEDGLASSDHFALFADIELRMDPNEAPAE